MEKFISEKGFFKLEIETISGQEPGIKISWGIPEELLIKECPTHLLIFLRGRRGRYLLNSEYFLLDLENLSKKIEVQGWGNYNLDAVLLKIPKNQKLPRKQDDLRAYLLPSHDNDQKWLDSLTAKLELDSDIFAQRKEKLKLRKKIAKIFSVFLAAILSLFSVISYFLYLIIAPTIAFISGYCPKKPREIFAMLMRLFQLKKEIKEPLAILYSLKAGKKRKWLHWYWGKKERVLWFSPVEVILATSSVAYLVFFVNEVNKPFIEAEALVTFFTLTLLSLFYLYSITSYHATRLTKETKEKTGLLMKVTSIFFVLIIISTLLLWTTGFLKTIWLVDEQSLEIFEYMLINTFNLKSFLAAFLISSGSFLTWLKFIKIVKASKLKKAEEKKTLVFKKLAEKFAEN